MYAKGISKQQLLDAAAQIGIRADVDTLNDAGTRHKVKLYPIVTPDMLTPRGYRKVRNGEKATTKYQRVGVGYMTAGRLVHSVCWHGFRDYFRACFERAPEAVFRTAIDTWKGSADFEARFRASGHRRVGPRIAPVRMASACVCGEEGIV